ncbi:MAG: SIR2 family protein [Pirellulales bacterium]
MKEIVLFRNKSRHSTSGLQMETIDKDSLRQLDNHLAASHQSWLFGAGISVEANIPLMYPLTNRIFNLSGVKGYEKTLNVLTEVRKELPENAHIEHILSHLGDLATLAERAKSKKSRIGKIAVELNEIRTVHAQVLDWIAETIRWGYTEAKEGVPEVVGTRSIPIIKISSHLQFMSAIYNRAQAGMTERRGALKFFTTNYDTLLEDALALGSFSYWDGFSGGAVAFRSHAYGKSEPERGFRAHVIKLHGSIDWHLDSTDRIWRVRDGDKYLDSPTRVLIYPQSTKYFATQHDPFAAQFELLRNTLCSVSENVLAICGYSFGDEHINQEIELALRRSDNKTTILAFTKTVGDVLRRWQSEHWSKRLFVIASDGLYVGASGPHFQSSASPHDWWTFNGAAKLLSSGAEACVL